MIKICVYTTNRAEYSKLRPILKLLQNDSTIDLSLLETCYHLLKMYGESILLTSLIGLTINSLVLLPPLITMLPDDT